MVQTKETVTYFNFVDDLLVNGVDAVTTGQKPITKPEILDKLKYNLDITKINTRNITDMHYLFVDNMYFNQDISQWDVSNVTDMTGLFRNLFYFNQDIGQWDVSSVTDTQAMFENALHFNQDISNWDVSNLKDALSMFEGASSFNQNLSKWNTQHLFRATQMFCRAVQFNQDISNWNFQNVIKINNIFEGASAMSKIYVQMFQSAYTRVKHENLKGIYRVTYHRNNRFCITYYHGEYHDVNSIAMDTFEYVTKVEEYTNLVRGYAEGDVHQFIEELRKHSITLSSQEGPMIQRERCAQCNSISINRKGVCRDC